MLWILFIWAVLNRRNISILVQVTSLVTVGQLLCGKLYLNKTKYRCLAIMYVWKKQMSQSGYTSPMFLSQYISKDSFDMKFSLDVSNEAPFYRNQLRRICTQ